jgi:hypothetical protein
LSNNFPLTTATLSFSSIVRSSSENI